MNQYYKVTEVLRDSLYEDGIVNNVTTGDIFNVDLNKTTIFPLSHIIVNNVTESESGNTNIFNVSVLLMDVCDISKAEATDLWLDNDNEQDIFNTQLEVGKRLIASLRRGNLYDMGFRLNGSISFEAFADRFENKLVGWTITLNVETANNTTIC
jgi:hypothetical protein